MLERIKQEKAPNVPREELQKDCNAVISDLEEIIEADEAKTAKEEEPESGIAAVSGEEEIAEEPSEMEPTFREPEPRAEDYESVEPTTGKKELAEEPEPRELPEPEKHAEGETTAPEEPISEEFAEAQPTPETTTPPVAGEEEAKTVPDTEPMGAAEEPKAISEGKQTAEQREKLKASFQQLLNVLELLKASKENFDADVSHLGTTYNVSVKCVKCEFEQSDVDALQELRKVFLEERASLWEDDDELKQRISTLSEIITRVELLDESIWKVKEIQESIESS